MALLAIWPNSLDLATRSRRPQIDGHVVGLVWPHCPDLVQRPPDHIGQMIGALTAMWLARTYGRPITERLVGSQRMARWENVPLSTSTVVWSVLLTAPTGDLPYFLAGLSKVSYTKIIIISLFIRIPASFVIAAAGAGVPWLTWEQMGIAAVICLLLVLLFLRYQEQILAWIEGRAQEVVARTE